MSADAGEERDVMLLCPFCGGGGVEMHPHDIARHGAEMPTQDGAQVQYAHCNGCGAEGPQAFTYAEAQTAWNRRAAITAYTSGRLQENEMNNDLARAEDARGSMGQDLPPHKFRKKPVVIEAYEWRGQKTYELPPWLQAAFLAQQARIVDPGPFVRLGILTLEGEMTAAIGDWIIRGVKGELYSCKPDIFALTYEAEGSADELPAARPGERSTPSLTSPDLFREGVEAALKRFQYAVSWVASDSWDHCGECRDRLEWAQSMAGEPLSFDEKSAIAKDYLRYSGTTAIRALSRK